MADLRDLRERMKDMLPSERTAYQLGAMEYLVDHAVERAEVAIARLGRKCPEARDVLAKLVADLRARKEAVCG